MPLVRCLFFFLLLFLCACAVPAPFIPALPESQLLVELTEDAVYAVHQDGDTIAYAAAGLHLLRLSDNYQQQLTYDSPDTLLWSADGDTLIATFPEAEKTRLVRLSSSAKNRPQILVDEQITDLAWLADDRLLAMAQIVTAENGVLQIQASLLIWDGQWDVERIPLYEKRLQHNPSELDLNLRHSFDLSALKDELIYNRYLDPPTLGGRVELVLYNLQTNRELVLSTTDNRKTEAFCAADGESVLMPDGRGQTQLVNPWTKKQDYRWPFPGNSLQQARQRPLFYIDGNLYGNDQLLLKLPAIAKVRFSEDGERMFAAWQGKLYLYSGYVVPEKLEYSKVEKVKLQRLRQQRSLGHMSIREYYQQRNNVLNP